MNETGSISGSLSFINGGTYTGNQIILNSLYKLGESFKTRGLSSFLSIFPNELSVISLPDAKSCDFYFF